MTAELVTLLYLAIRARGVEDALAGLVRELDRAEVGTEMGLLDDARMALRVLRTRLMEQATQVEAGERP